LKLGVRELFQDRDLLTAVRDDQELLPRFPDESSGSVVKILDGDGFRETYVSLITHTVNMFTCSWRNSPPA
jgi:hypothetical protein